MFKGFQGQFSLPPPERGYIMPLKCRQVYFYLHSLFKKPTLVNYIYYLSKWDITLVWKSALPDARPPLTSIVGAGPPSLGGLPLRTRRSRALHSPFLQRRAVGTLSLFSFSPLNNTSWKSLHGIHRSFLTVFLKMKKEMVWLHSLAASLLDRTLHRR